MKFQPAIAQKEPYILYERKGFRKAWCSCGLSKSQPYCDGEHAVQETGMKPRYITLPEDGYYRWCGCKRTGTPPFCDETHRTL